MSPYQLFYQFFLGLALGVVAVKTGNIVLCIIMHAFSNLLVIVLAFFPQIEVFFLSSPYFIIVGVVALFCFALAFLFVAKFLKMEHTVELKRDKNAQNNGDEIGLLVYIITIVVCLAVCVFAIFG